MARRIWQTIGVLMLVPAMLWGAWTAWGALARQSSYTERTYWERITAVEVSGADASVSVEASAPDRVTVQERLTWDLRRPEVSVSVVNGVLNVSADCPTVLGVPGCGMYLGIQVPPTVAVHTVSQSGFTTVKGVSGEVWAMTASGSVLLDGISGPVWVKTSSGEITGSGLASAKLKVATASGKTRLEFVRPPDQLTAGASSGRVSIEVPTSQTRYRVEGQSVSGSWDVDPDVVDSSSAHLIDVTTQSGSVDISAARE